MEFERQNKQLRSDIKRLGKVIESYEKRSQSLRLEIKSLERQVTSLRKENFHHLECLGELYEERDELKQEVATLRRREGMNPLAEENKKLRSEIEELRLTAANATDKDSFQVSSPSRFLEASRDNSYNTSPTTRGGTVSSRTIACQTSDCVSVRTERETKVKQATHIQADDKQAIDMQANDKRKTDKLANGIQAKDKQANDKQTNDKQVNDMQETEAKEPRVFRTSARRFYDKQVDDMQANDMQANDKQTNDKQANDMQETEAKAPRVFRTSAKGRFRRMSVRQSQETAPGSNPDVPFSIPQGSQGDDCLDHDAPARPLVRDPVVSQNISSTLSGIVNDMHSTTPLGGNQTPSRHDIDTMSSSGGNQTQVPSCHYNENISPLDDNRIPTSHGRGTDKISGLDTHLTPHIGLSSTSNHDRHTDDSANLPASLSAEDGTVSPGSTILSDNSSMTPSFSSSPSTSSASTQSPPIAPSESEPKTFARKLENVPTTTENSELEGGTSLIKQSPLSRNDSVVNHGEVSVNNAPPITRTQSSPPIDRTQSSPPIDRTQSSPFPINASSSRVASTSSTHSSETIPIDTPSNTPPSITETSHTPLPTDITSLPADRIPPPTDITPHPLAITTTTNTPTVHTTPPINTPNSTPPPMTTLENTLNATTTINLTNSAHAFDNTPTISSPPNNSTPTVDNTPHPVNFDDSTHAANYSPLVGDTHGNPSSTTPPNNSPPTVDNTLHPVNSNNSTHAANNPSLVGDTHGNPSSTTPPINSPRTVENTLHPVNSNRIPPSVNTPHVSNTIINDNNDNTPLAGHISLPVSSNQGVTFATTASAPSARSTSSIPSASSVPSIPSCNRARSLWKRVLPILGKGHGMFQVSGCGIMYKHNPSLSETCDDPSGLAPYSCIRWSKLMIKTGARRATPAGSRDPDCDLTGIASAVLSGEYSLPHHQAPAHSDHNVASRGPVGSRGLVIHLTFAIDPEFELRRAVHSDSVECFGDVVFPATDFFLTGQCLCDAYAGEDVKHTSGFLQYLKLLHRSIIRVHLRSHSEKARALLFMVAQNAIKDS